VEDIVVYKVLLVDDEVVVREGIKERINWSELGLVCVGDCENGMEAMEAVDLLLPDVVLTDINMPFVDGLELTRYLLEHHPFTKVIILTGYDDFSYAQQAIKLSVKDFILKPITAKELHKVLEKVTAEMNEDKRKREDLDRLRIQLNESLPLLKERFLERMVTSSIHPREREERLEYFQISLNTPCYLAIAIEIDYFPKDHQNADKDLLRFAVFNVIQEVIEQEAGSVTFRNRDEKVIVILSGQAEEPLFDIAQKLAEQIRHLIESYLKFTVTVGIGHSCSNLNHFLQSYESAMTALEYRFLLGANKVISIMDMEGHRAATNGEYQEDWEQKLISCMKTGTENELKETLQAIIQQYKNSFPSIKQCYIHIQKLIIYLIRDLNQLGLQEVDIFGEVNPITHIYQFQTLEEMESWLFDCCRHAINTIIEQRNDFCNSQVRAAEAYLKQHYSDEGLSLAKICKYVHMSTSYFSSVFKAHTGKTFIEYLTAERISNAKELLKFTSLKTYEIASRVGYQDPHYFSMLFKKITGDSPTEYRQRCLAEKE
jgi:two-component system response regulator YesN